MSVVCRYSDSYFMGMVKVVMVKVYKIKPITLMVWLAFFHRLYLVARFLPNILRF